MANYYDYGAKKRNYVRRGIAKARASSYVYHVLTQDMSTRPIIYKIGVYVDIRQCEIAMWGAALNKEVDSFKKLGN